MMNLTGMWSLSLLSTFATYANSKAGDNQILTCPPLATPANSEPLFCTGGFSFGSTCESRCLSTFSRDAGFIIKVTCQMAGDWDGELTPCVGEDTGLSVPAVATAPNCGPWSSWSVCENCDLMGQGTTKRQRMCAPGMPQFENQPCRTCTTCTNKVSAGVQPCVCVAGSGDTGIAQESFFCEEGRITLRRQSFVTCKCDGCSSSPCKNGGTCNPTTSGSLYQCTCPPEFSGSHCETKVNCVHRYCFNGGRCLDNNAARRVCACSSWSQGDRCATIVNCTQWALWDCKSCGFNIETRLCYDQWSVKMYLKNMKSSPTQDEVKRLSLAVEAVLGGDMVPVSYASGATCEWTSWSACVLGSLPPPSINSCSQIRRQMCRVDGNWLPSERVESRACTCPETRLSAFENWSQWTAPDNCWPGICNSPNFRRRQRVEVQWHDGSLRSRDVILDLTLCDPLICTDAPIGVAQPATISWLCENGMCKPDLREPETGTGYGLTFGIRSGPFLISVGVVGASIIGLSLCCFLVLVTRGNKRSKRVSPMPPMAY